VGEQRYHHKKLLEGRPSSLTPRRIELLNDLGFDWNVFDAQWMDKYRRLQDHVRINGGVLNRGGRRSIPRQDKEMRNWILHQLKLYRAKHHRGESSSLSDDREKMLKELGFPW
jgi:hypothetical protein